MRKRATKVVLFLLLGAMVNLFVALSFDWYANTTTQTTSLLRPEDARSRGWIDRVPADAIAAWGWERAGLSSVAVVVFDDGAQTELDLTNNLIRFPFTFESDVNGPPAARESAAVIESRVGWPMRAFAGRIETERSPGLIPLGGSGLRRAKLVGSLDGIAGRPLAFDLRTNSIRLESGSGQFDRMEPISERLDISGLTVDPDFKPHEFEKGVAPPVRPEHRDDGANTARPRAASRQAIIRDESTEQPAADTGIEFTGHMGIGIAEFGPIPAAANGRWNVQSLIQNFDPDHRVWPLAYRPVWPGFAINSALYALLIWLIAACAMLLLRTLGTKPGHCPKCGYDMRGGPHERCPECGCLTQDAAA